MHKCFEWTHCCAPLNLRVITKKKVRFCQLRTRYNKRFSSIPSFFGADFRLHALPFAKRRLNGYISQWTFMLVLELAEDEILCSLATSACQSIHYERPPNSIPSILTDASSAFVFTHSPSSKDISWFTLSWRESHPLAIIKWVSNVVLSNSNSGCMSRSCQDALFITTYELMKELRSAQLPSCSTHTFHY